MLSSATVLASAADLVSTFFENKHMPKETQTKVMFIAQANVIFEIFKCLEKYGLNPDVNRLNPMFKDTHPQLWNIIQCHVYRHPKKIVFDWAQLDFCNVIPSKVNWECATSEGKQFMIYTVSEMLLMMFVSFILTTVNDKDIEENLKFDSTETYLELWKCF